MNNKNFETISELKEYINDFMKLPSEKIFKIYLSKIFSNLLQREENINNTKSKRFSREQKSIIFLQKDSINNLTPEKENLNLSLNNFLEYMDIQEFIGERIFKFLNRSKKNNKLTKDDFCEGLNNIYYGNIKALINFTFNLADFNEDGKIYDADMELILKYIPCASEFSQKNYLKQINKIVSKFFEDLNLTINSSEKNQLNLTTYQTCIEEYTIKIEKNLKNNEINSEFLFDYEYNAPFFYFISIVSYLFKNLPFNPKTVEFFQNQKKIQKIKLGIGHNPGLLSLRNHNQKLLTTERKKNIYKNMTNSKINSTFRSTATIGTNRFSYNPNDKMVNEALPKIGRTNLFNIKKSSSQVFLKKENLNKAILSITLNKNKNKRNSSNNNNKHEFIIARKKENQNKDIKDISAIFPQQEKNLIEHNFIKRYNSKKQTHKSNNNESLSISTTKNSSLLLNQSQNIRKIFLTPDLFLNKSNSNEMKEKFINLRQKLPSLSLSQKRSPLIGIAHYQKIKDELKDDIEEFDEFKLCELSENDGSSNTNSLIGRDSNKSENIFQLNETYIYKYDENDFHLNILNKYYALIKDKEIIFFYNESKSEFYDLWYINKSYITTGKETLGKINYYTINITFENNQVKKLYFLSESLCQGFSLSIKNSIKDYNFYDFYDIMNDLGEGHFGKVCKCKNKKSNDYFAVKIINKPKLNSVDLELIRQEKNFLKLIKHENIISLKDFFEDKQYIYFITDFYEGGDLLSYLEEKQKNKEKISEKNCARIIRKIAQGIQYLNCFGIIHRDIKPENIMFARDSNIKTLKIIDLGVCKTLSYGQKTNEPIGTNGYISPEIYLHKEYSYSIDVWSLGVILYLLITGGILPFDDINMDCKVIAKKVIYLQQDYPEEFFGDKSKKLVNLLDKMLEKDENKRIDINNLLKDSWFDIIKK